MRKQGREEEKEEKAEEEGKVEEEGKGVAKKEVEPGGGGASHLQQLALPHSRTSLPPQQTVQ